MHWRYQYGSKTLHALTTTRSTRSLCGLRVSAPEYWLGGMEVVIGRRLCGTCTLHTTSRPSAPQLSDYAAERPSTPMLELTVLPEVPAHELRDRMNRVLSRLHLVVRYPCSQRDDCTAHLDCLAHQVECALMGAVKERSVA